ncbi:MAG: DUF456 domain-containing protein [Phycisphaeraceae bacterium]|nr:DUF456 domain-containing protein [Phycisphaeraceae bacterium]
MAITLAITLVLANLVCLALVLLGLPGTWLMVLLAAGYAWMYPDQLAIWTVVGITVLALLGELAEFAFSAATSHAAGSSRRGLAGALIGGIIGGLLGTLIPIPVIGTLLGACGGAGLGATGGDLWAGRPWEDSLLAGRSAAWGRFQGTVTKFILGVAMAIWLSVALFV